jgi:hypothetical protein
MRNLKILQRSCLALVSAISEINVFTFHCCRFVTVAIWADIVLLLLNPGFSFTDYYAERFKRGFWPVRSVR